MSTFNLPAKNNVSAFTITKFGGVDFWSSPENVDKSRSSSCVNMIRDKNGSIRKRMGYEKVIDDAIDSRINGACSFGSGHLIHGGTSLYLVNENGERTLIYADIADSKSTFIPYDGMVYVITGKELLYVTSEGNCDYLSNISYVPTVIVSKAPSGGGTLYENYNLLSDRWKEQFLADGESTVYNLEKKDLSAVVGVWLREENGEMKAVDRETYTVSLENGTVTFSSPPSIPQVVGMDNVIIEVSKLDENMLLECTVGTLYGADGKDDRLFIGGNPKYPGMDFFSAPGNLTYFPHLNYSKLSRFNISGYSKFNGSLNTHFEEDVLSGESKIIKRDAGKTSDGSETFLISGEYTAPSMISPHTSFFLNDEALYLSKKGIFGITVSDVTSEKVCQLRSAFLGDAFSAFSEEELRSSHGVIFGDYYAVSMGGKMYLLDGSAKSYFSGTPLCSYQYECYYFENIPARVIWTDGTYLYFGSENGFIYRFFSNVSSAQSYTDDGVKVTCRFETSDIDDGIFFKKKTYASVSAKIGAFLNTGVKIYARTDGKWHDKPIYNSMGRGRYFDFSLIDFESISFSSNKSEVTLCGKVRIRNTDSVRFRIENDKAEPFLLLGFGAEYVQKGNYVY